MNRDVKGRVLSSAPAFAHACSQAKRELRLGKPREGCLAVARSAKADLPFIAETPTCPLGACPRTAPLGGSVRDAPRTSAGFASASPADVNATRYVYGVQSEVDPERFYVGVTSDVQSRLRAHNAGESRHTRRYRPWRLVVAVEFASEERALAFERYLKTGSGRAFAKRHFS